MSTRHEVYEAIDTERDYQKTIWQSLDTVEPMTMAKTLTLLAVYVSKAQQAWCGEAGNEKSREVLRKIAGIAVAGLEHNGAPKRAVQPT